MTHRHPLDPAEFDDWDFSPIKIHHARIMVECGCRVEDVALTLGMLLAEAIYAVAPALKANRGEQERVRRILKVMRLPPPLRGMHVIHSYEGSVGVPTATQRRKVA